jgi:hypothetical protein
LVDNASPWCLTHEQTGDSGLRLRAKAAAYGIAGVVIAGAVIFSGSALGLLNFNSLGTLSILLTDPPSVPTGVTAVYVTYSDLAVHASGFGDSGWVSIPGQGTIDTLVLVNLSRTISSAQIPAITYDLVRFDISKASIDFNGRSYTVSVNSGRLTVAFVGGLKVNSSSAAAALVDISPTVLNVGSNSIPDFTMAAGAHALQVPPRDVGDSMKTVGNESSLEGRGWFQSFRSDHSDNLTVSGLTLSPNSLTFTARNPGSDPMTIKMVVVTPDNPKEMTGAALGAVGGSIVFAVQSDGSLKLLSGNADEVGSLFEGHGYTLAGGTSFRFTFTAEITSMMGAHAVSSGRGYTVVVMGSDPLSVETVVAA